MSFNVSHVFYVLVPVLDRSDAERFLVYNFAKFCSRTSTRGQKSGSDCSYPSQFVAHELRWKYYTMFLSQSQSVCQLG